MVGEGGMKYVRSIRKFVIKIHFAPALKSNLCLFLGICFPARIMWRKTNVGNLCVVKSFLFSRVASTPYHPPSAQHPQLDSCEPLSMGKGSASCKTGAGPAIIFSATPNSSTPPSLSLRFFGFLQNEAQRSVWQTDFSQTQIRALKRKGKKKCRNFHKIRITAVILYEGPQRQSRTRRRTPKFMSSTKNM